MSQWIDSLQQASFRGIPFGVLSGAGRFGRRLALHEYPNRDKPWPEDMGRATRRIALTGFLISDSAVYAGGGSLSGGVSALVGRASALRAEVTSAAQSLQQLTAGLGVGGASGGGVAGAASSVAAAVRGASSSASDGIRVLSQLARFGR